MKKTCSILMGLCLLALSAGAWAGEKTPLNVYWDEGVHFKSDDGRFDVGFGGRVFCDWTFIKAQERLQTTLGENQIDGVEFRKARMKFYGTIYEHVEYEFQMDFAKSQEPKFKDAYLGLTDVPYVGNIRMGQFKEPFGLEEETSGKFITFMERASPEVFSPGRNTGIMLRNTLLDKRFMWAAGIFRDVDEVGEGKSETGLYNFTTRLTGLPYWEDESKFLHVGCAYSYRSPENGEVRYKTEPESHLFMDEVVNTTKIGDDVGTSVKFLQLVGPEVAFVWGPASLQWQGVKTYVDQLTGTDNLQFNGYYLETSYFLTGEHRRYDRSDADWRRILPNENFMEDGGLGAWEVAARYSQLDLTNGPVTGGYMENYTLGLNWHLNPNTKIKFNWVHSEVKDGDDGDINGNANIFMLRFQIDWDG